jgi:uncharacterized membrane protein YedE/YeeE
MTFPLEAVVARPELASLLGVLVGFGFGFVLERAGFGDARKLLGQFYGTEMVMLKVMFGAIVTAVLGTAVLAGIGLLDLRALADVVTAPTFLWPMIAGGVLVGVGIVLSGYCPGTSFVGIASGKLDAAVAFAGVIVGQLAWAELEFRGRFAAFHESGALGHLYLPDLLKVPPAVVAAAIVAMAAGAFLVAERIERAVRGPAAGPEDRSPRRRVLAGFAGAALVALATLALPHGTAAVTPPPPISPEALARRVLDAPWTVRVLDVRPLDACAAARVPGAECAPPEALAGLGLADLAPERELVVVGAGALAEVPGEIRAYRGRVVVLEGGWEAWKAFALTPAEAPAPGASPAALETWRLRTGLNAAFTGAAAPPVPVQPAGGGARPKKKAGGGGCG